MPDGARLAQVLRPGSIGSLALDHRIVMGSMHLGIEPASDGGAALAAFYAERARGGAGLIVTGGWAVSRVGAGGRTYGFVNEDAGARTLGRVAQAVHAHGARIALQLFHAGRYAFEDAFGLQPVAPSAVPSRFSRANPAALSQEAIGQTIEDFARAAARGRDLGYDALEVMGSEGYLVDQFLSPLTNLRDDAWGGDPRRRMRFGLELMRSIRGAVGPDFPVIFRLTGVDLMPGSTSPAEVAQFAQELVRAGADALNVGIGWHESPVPTVQGVVAPGAWAPWARAIKDAVGSTPVIAGNRVNRLAVAERLLAGGGMDFVSMARPFLADSQILARARRGDPVNVCIACNQACIDRSITDGHVSCMVNPRAGHELEHPWRDGPDGVPGTARAPGRFAVIGGGPAGMEAARALADAGHHVDLFEAAGELGGQFRLARLVPGKEDFAATIRYFELELQRLGVRVRLGVTLTDRDVDLLAGFDGLVLATGVLPRQVGLPGANLSHVLDYPRAFAAGVTGERIAIIGAGGIGVDLAHRLTAAPPGRHQVTLMCRGGRIGGGIGRTTRWVALEALRRAGVDSRTGVQYHEITPEGVLVSEQDGRERLIAADAVVIAAGQQPNDALGPLLQRIGIPHRVAGGAREAAGLDAVRAFGEGLAAACDLVATRSPARRADSAEGAGGVPFPGRPRA